MRLKSYFSGTVEAAMELARRELGEDALLVNARPATPETKHLGAYEVVFGSTGASAIPATAPPQPDRFAQDLTEMKRAIERLTKCLSGPRMATPAAQPELYSNLVANELDPMIAQAVHAGHPLEQFFEVDATLG